MRYGFLGGGVGALLPITIVGCLHTVDLRDDAGQSAGDSDCGANRRIDPASGACASCQRDARDPLDVCPCAFHPSAGEFPLCEGDDVTFTCEPCTGDITSCSAVAADFSVRDCTLLGDCCAELALAGSPCCEGGATLFCEVGGGGTTYAYTFTCLDPLCCESGCSAPSDCDETFQTCESGRCVPGCKLDEQFCSTPACECRPSPT
jgi:hypothetical protein